MEQKHKVHWAYPCQEIWMMSEMCSPTRDWPTLQLVIDPFSESTWKLEIKYHHHFEIGFKSALYYTTALCFTFSDPPMRRMASNQKMTAIYINAK